MSKKTKSQTTNSLNLSDMNTDIDYNIKEIKYNKFHELHGSSLILEFSGKSLNIKHINAIPRFRDIRVKKIKLMTYIAFK